MNKISFYILFGAFCLLGTASCKRKNKLEGIWIGAYEISYQGADTIYSELRFLLDIGKEEIGLKTFDYPNFEEKDTLELLKYTVSADTLFLDKDTLYILGLNQDSLILSYKPAYNKGYSSNFALKRLPEKGSRLNTELCKKAYAFSGPHHSDSIDFINDSTVLHMPKATEIFFSTNNWAVNSYKSYDFFIIDDFFYPPALIDYDSGHVIGLKLFYKDIINLKLEQIKGKKDTTGLLGNWVWPCLKSDSSPPPSPTLHEGVDPKLYLRIYKDYIEIEKYGKMRTKKWQLNSTQEFICFPNDLKTENVWEIIELSNDELLIEKHDKFSENNKKLLLFKRNKGLPQY